MVIDLTNDKQRLLRYHVNMIQGHESITVITNGIKICNMIINNEFKDYDHYCKECSNLDVFYYTKKTFDDFNNHN